MSQIWFLDSMEPLNKKTGPVTLTLASLLFQFFSQRLRTGYSLSTSCFSPEKWLRVPLAVVRKPPAKVRQICDIKEGDDVEVSWS